MSVAGFKVVSGGLVTGEGVLKSALVMIYV